MCTQIIPIATACFIVWNFKAQSTPIPRLVQNFYGFCRGREISLVPVALVSFISIVEYIIYGLTQSIITYSSLANIAPGFSMVEHQLVPVKAYCKAGF